MSFGCVKKLSCEKYQKKVSGIVKYGTAGFRSIAEELDFIMFRMGLLACLRSCQKRAAIGIMITASHNPVEDNGVKLIDPSGDVLTMSWEMHATTLANAGDDKIDEVLTKIIDHEKIDMNNNPIVFVGRDTRPSSNRLLEAVVDGLRIMSAEVRDFGVVSTPVVHFVVACYNGNESYGQPTEEGYIRKLSEAFCTLRKFGSNSNKKYSPVILFDGANGVGAQMMSKFIPHLGDWLKVKMYNTGEGTLNFQCGADYVKTSQSWPLGVELKKNMRCASFDGDADRLIYSYVNDDGKFVLLDGDKIGILVAAYLKKLLETADIDLNLGLVQTAYSNGASTAYIENNLGISLCCAKTGVKYLHEAALHYDIGVYFEANGHGTVIFSDKARDIITNKAKEENATGAVELQCVMNVINETVGDAVSDLLLVESVLSAYDWSENEWSESYTDLPNELAKVKVSDRSVFETTNAERTCVRPEGLQEKIDSAVSQSKCGRSFVRPSGTEDIVRIYAEAKTPEEARALALQVSCLVYDIAGGVGPRPH